MQFDGRNIVAGGFEFNAQEPIGEVVVLPPDMLAAISIEAHLPKREVEATPSRCDTAVEAAYLACVAIEQANFPIEYGLDLAEPQLRGALGQDAFQYEIDRARLTNDDMRAELYQKELERMQAGFPKEIPGARYGSDNSFYRYEEDDGTVLGADAIIGHLAFYSPRLQVESISDKVSVEVTPYFKPGMEEVAFYEFQAILRLDDGSVPSEEAAQVLDAWRVDCNNRLIDESAHTNVPVYPLPIKNRRAA